MEKISRDQFVDRLETDWGAFVERFQGLSAEEQKCYLEKQGYASFPELLSHVIAWWQDGTRVVADMRGNPGLPLPDYDVDDFNAQAVLKFGSISEPDVLQMFEDQRQAMLRLVTGLPEDDFSCGNINTRLYYEIMMHWQEHELEG